MTYKRVLSSVLVFAMMTSLVSIPAFAEEPDIVSTTIGETYYFDCPQPIAEERMENTDQLLFTTEEIAVMTEEEFATSLKEKTPLDDMEIEQIVSYYKSDDFKNGIAPVYGIYDHPEWLIEPYVKSTVKGVTYSTEWIGIDAYRSSVGMSKGKTETKNLTVKLGFSGSKEIKKVTAGISAEFSRTTTTTVSESQTCPAWTTMNWRPYTLYWIDTYYGKMKITTIIPNMNGVYEKVWYEDHNGTNRRLITETTEVWSRVNTKHDLKAITPAPPTGAPDVF